MNNDKITDFRGHYAFLSNFFPSPIIMDDVVWMTAEHLYQAAKCTNLKDVEAIRSLASPGEAKRAGRKVTMRADWDDVKIDVMKQVIELKFEQNPALKLLLRETRTREIGEVNTWGDTYWGVSNGYGKNHLGLILMAYREKLIVQNTLDI